MDSSEVTTMTRKRYSIQPKKDMNIGNKYILQEMIGEGTYGYVWKALRCDDGEIVALKIPKSQERGDAALVEGERFVGVTHENIINIYWMGRVDGYFTIEMELFDGRPLSRELSEEGISHPRTFQKMFDIFDKVLNGVEFMHAQCVAHGDIKPDNILINDSTVKITDFGTSRLIEDIFVKTIDGAGTFAYIAPEVLHSQKRFLNSDIYSLGVLLYQLLTGKTPHDTYFNVIHNVPFPKPRELNDSITPFMEKVIMKALERNPEMRYPSIIDFRTDFKKAVTEHFKQQQAGKFVPRVTLANKRDPLELAIMNCKLGKFTLAEKILATEITNGNTLPEILLQLAYVYFKTNRLFEALRTIESIEGIAIEATRQESFDMAVQNVKARVFLEMKKYEEALGIYQKLYQKDSKNLDYRYKLALCYGLCGQEEKSIKILEEINQETPGIWVVVKKLGQAYDQKKEYERARGYFKYALRLRPDDEYVKRKLDLYEFYL
jgi:serine/threonine protein kinase